MPLLKSPESLTLFNKQRLLIFAAPKYYLLSKLGLIHSQLGQYHQAAAAYQEALEEVPLDYAATLGLADCHYQLGDAAEAEKLYRAIISDEEKSPPIKVYQRFSELINKREPDAEDLKLLENKLDSLHKSQD